MENLLFFSSRLPIGNNTWKEIIMLNKQQLTIEKWKSSIPSDIPRWIMGSPFGSILGQSKQNELSHIIVQLHDSWMRRKHQCEIDYLQKIKELIYGVLWHITDCFKQINLWCYVRLLQILSKIKYYSSGIFCDFLMLLQYFVTQFLMTNSLDILSLK